MDDGAIVDLFLKRDGEAVSALSEKYGKRLKALAMRILSDPLEAEECLNDAYFRAWELIPPSEPREYLFPFVGRIVRGLAIDRVRAASSRKRSAELTALTGELLECVPSRDGAEDAAVTGELSSLINGFVKTLPREKQLIFIRRYWYFETAEETARALGISAGKVRTELCRIRKKLKEHLERNGYTV